MMPSLLRVMYAPLDYIHPHHFQPTKDAISPLLQRAINHGLIKRFSLNTAIDFKLQASDFSHLLVSHWDLTPHVAWLLGCKLARGSLARDGHLATLPGVARQFIELPLACPAFELNEELTAENIRLHGARYIFLLKQHLPVALAQRLCLLFGPASGADMQIAHLNRSLLTFAFDYAKNFKN
jgi:type III secretion system OrgA/MxiK family protein